ncbi:putative tetratricopeptide TPR2 protein [Reticulomyxa filosa]|uniref:Putative tetratricopeptide TPR2 protein n=1 Tax=Reticulomyxa filosa TaxID=46433 RepID=X6PE36_RETFI|nr:putative tetratricopeptide TPR2 protein [Reticulomyxa filosa]|eukprot:ETO35922.1 putative tetratricopeptide TPR2 protein [Reticulomyxa filosa]
MKFGKKALDLRLKKFDSNHPEVGNSYDILGDINYKKGDKMEAKKCYENTLSIYTQKFGENNQKIQEVMLKLKNLLFGKKRKFYFVVKN